MKKRKNPTSFMGRSVKLKRYLYERLYFIYYSVKEFLLDIVNIIKELKKPKMWLAILYATFFVAAYMRNFKLMKWVLPPIFIVYLIRQKIEKHWKGELFAKDLKRGIDSNIVKEHYSLYKKQRYFAHKEFSDFDEWKANEIKRIGEKHKSVQDAQH